MYCANNPLAYTDPSGAAYITYFENGEKVGESVYQSTDEFLSEWLDDPYHQQYLEDNWESYDEDILNEYFSIFVEDFESEGRDRNGNYTAYHHSISVESSNYTFGAESIGKVYDTGLGDPDRYSFETSLYNASSSGGALGKWLTNPDPYATVGVNTKQYLGAGGKVSILGIQYGFAGNIYSSKRSGTISSNGYQSSETKITNVAINYAIIGGEYERDWTGKKHIGSFDFGPFHFESGKYPVFRIFSISGQFIGGGSVDVDVNLGRAMNDYGQSQLYYYNKTGRLPTMYGF